MALPWRRGRTTTTVALEQCRSCGQIILTGLDSSVMAQSIKCEMGFIDLAVEVHERSHGRGTWELVVLPSGRCEFAYRDLSRISSSHRPLVVRTHRCTPRPHEPYELTGDVVASPLPEQPPF
jgi:hypothetical protein